MYRLSTALISVALLSMPAMAAETGKPADAITCASPFKPGDTAKTIKARYKGDVTVEDVDGAEGETSKALMVFAKDPARKLELSFWDDEMTKLAAVGPAEKAKAWTIAGLKVGSTLDEVIKANGGNFDLSGFEWDYGGFVTDLKGGKLSKLDGGCTLTLRFNPGEGKSVPNALSGDRTLSSNNAKLAKLAPYVSEIQVSWADPDDKDGGAD